MKDTVTVEVPLEELDCLIYDSYGTENCIIRIEMEQLKQLLTKAFEDGMKCGVEDYLQEQKWEKEKQR